MANRNMEKKSLIIRKMRKTTKRDLPTLVRKAILKKTTDKYLQGKQSEGIFASCGRNVTEYIHYGIQCEMFSKNYRTTT